MNANSEPRRHHWIPQVYLKGFTHNRSKNSKLFAVGRDGTSFWTTPANVGATRDFNRIEVHGIDPHAVEKAMSGFESELGRALVKISATKNFDDEGAWICVLNLVALLAVRNPHGREQMRQFQEDVSRMILDIALATPERWTSHMRQMERDGAAQDLPKVSYENVKRFHDDGDYMIEVPTGRHVAMEFHAFDPVLHTMVDRRWLLCTPASDAGGFITSDHPVCLMNTDGSAPTFSRPLGFGLTETTVLFPVTHELLAVGTFEGTGGLRELRPLQVAYFNGLIRGFAKRQLYSADDRFRLLVPDRATPLRGSELAQHIRSRPKHPKNMVKRKYGSPLPSSGR